MTIHNIVKHKKISLFDTDNKYKSKINTNAHRSRQFQQRVK